MRARGHLPNDSLNHSVSSPEFVVTPWTRAQWALPALVDRIDSAQSEACPGDRPTADGMRF